MLKLKHNIFFFFFNDTATTEIYTLSLHDALPISQEQRNAAQNVYRSVEHDQKTGLTTFGQFHQHHSQMHRDESAWQVKGGCHRHKRFGQRMKNCDQGIDERRIVLVGEYAEYHNEVADREQE